MEGTARFAGFLPGPAEGFGIRLRFFFGYFSYKLKKSRQKLNDKCQFFPPGLPAPTMSWSLGGDEELVERWKTTDCPGRPGVSVVRVTTTQSSTSTQVEKCSRTGQMKIVFKPNLSQNEYSSASTPVAVLPPWLSLCPAVLGGRLSWLLCHQQQHLATSSYKRPAKDTRWLQLTTT